ncbi:hypothetical protein BJ875DRAFT_59153 [Amylocarpus encephaloides]|uniref:Uncharacterized protein n=1 Tax=Amylocarpus encephaloides TaxID=45428 RepID=A0A9P8C413_9HELO|nr:hypothetical protein BJ875DRAFT_59153 [Amylocarpus encephaloides]
MDLLGGARTAGECDGAHRIFAATLLFSFRQIRITSPEAAAIMSIIGYFDHQDIPKFIVRRPGVSLLGFETALGKLRDYSMIIASAVDSDSGDSAFHMHSLVQLVSRQAHLTSVWLGESFTVLSKHPPPPVPLHLTKSSRLMAHVWIDFRCAETLKSNARQRNTAAPASSEQMQGHPEAFDDKEEIFQLRYERFMLIAEYLQGNG